MRTLLRIVFTVLAVVGALAIVLGILVIHGGMTARAKASGMEKAVADAVREMAAPRSARREQSPFAGTPEVLTHGREHFAGECALCHGNDGKGSDLGKRMFPPVPNLVESVKDLTNGEIFYVIQNGIRFSGMPGFADPEDPNEAGEHWQVVYFVRHLPDLTAGEIEEMKRYNPRPPGETEPGAPPAQEHEHGAEHEHGHGR